MKTLFAYIVRVLYNSPTMNKDSKKHNNQMKSKQIKFPEDLWETAQAKAGTMHVSAVIRRLVERWVKGEISLDN